MNVILGALVRRIRQRAYLDSDEEIARWIEEYCEQSNSHKHGVMQGCQCKDRIGETKVWCCNQCGLPCEDFWLPTHYTVGSRTVASEGSDKNA